MPSITPKSNLPLTGFEIVFRQLHTPTPMRLACAHFQTPPVPSGTYDLYCPHLRLICPMRREFFGDSFTFYVKHLLSSGMSIPKTLMLFCPSG